MGVIMEGGGTGNLAAWATCVAGESNLPRMTSLPALGFASSEPTSVDGRSHVNSAQHNHSVNSATHTHKPTARRQSQEQQTMQRAALCSRVLGILVAHWCAPTHNFEMTGRSVTVEYYYGAVGFNDAEFSPLL